MKQSERFFRRACAGAMFAACVTAGLAVHGQETLTRSQWKTQIGASALNPATLRDTMARIAPEDKVDFTEKVLKAAVRFPANPEEKSAALVKTASACIAEGGGAKREVIAEIFAGVPLPHLPTVTEELAKRFDQEYNALSDDQYGRIAAETLDAAIKRNAATDIPSVRNTFVILAFLRGAKDSALKDRLISRLPEERMRRLAAAWIPPALSGKNYDAMLAAGDVDALPIRTDVMLQLVGHSNLDRLLADLNANRHAVAESDDELGTNAVESAWIPLSQIRATDGITGQALTGGRGGQLDHAMDYGINRVPRLRGYQNQGLSVRR